LYNQNLLPIQKITLLTCNSMMNTTVFTLQDWNYFCIIYASTSSWSPAPHDTDDILKENGSKFLAFVTDNIFRNTLYRWRHRPADWRFVVEDCRVPDLWSADPKLM